jgi:rod shape-determining protein MreC
VRSVRGRRVLVVLVLGALTLLTLDARGWSPLKSARVSAVDGLQPVVDSADGFFGPVTNAWNGLFHYGEVADRNKELSARVAELESRQEFLQSLEVKLGKQSNQNQQEWAPAIERVRANVITSRPSNFEQTVQLNRGSNQGIQPGNPVLSGDGVVGKVVQVSATTATVRLLTDTAFRVSVVVADTRDPALVVGEGPDNPMSVELLYQSNDQRPTVFVGDVVVTNGSAESLFPANLPIGKVTRVRQQRGTQQLLVQVEPLVDLDRLEIVSVLLYVPPKPFSPGG